MSSEKYVSREISLLELRLVAKYKSEGKTKESFARDVAFTSKSTLHRKLDPQSELTQPLLGVFARYLGETEENVLRMHRNESNEREDCSSVVPTHSIVLNQKILLFTASILFILISLFVFLSGEDVKPFYAKYAGEGIDVDLSMLEAKAPFHAPLYKHKFDEVYVKINGERVEMITNVTTTSLADPNLQYTATFKASGPYLNGRGALSYQMTALSNSEVWTGVMMLDIPTTGDAFGYWLTMHSDGDSEGLFALGDLKLTRSWDALPTNIAEKF